MPLPVTAAFAGLLALFFVLLSIRTIMMRGKAKVPLGTGGNPALERVVRGHANFAEYTPLALLLLMVAELNGGHVYLLCGAGSLLLVGRLLHGICFAFMQHSIALRVTGMVLTFTAINVLAIAVLLQAAGPI